MSRLFIDLDVLADFEAGVRDALKMSVQDFVDLHGERFLWRCVERVPKFFDRLPWTADGRQLWDGLGDVWTGPPPMILTQLPFDLRGADLHKHDWCDRELGRGVPVICCVSVDKRAYCCPGDVLIDGRASMRPDWEEAGGFFIHHTDAVSSLERLRDRAD